ncbi:CHC2 zinc finger domain-containing protein [Halobacteriovorax sp. JY17]|uniref:CHC2 zinc finger domain-containing protein n=1 Tax=Halobacteriovorax sp. JY17 TaxID=2014617 RepID=UPI000C679492|nr:CHC2 zinc finger domain-containing protein [Halobacteriovorax sp. JY17]PIK14383.1 MAG: hypothetical protein CES88_08555 [Halobacteriovorax sp. JY17]
MMRDKIDKIKNVDISSILGHFIHLKVHQNKYRGLCPFCHNRKETLFVDDHKSIYYCSEDGGGGDAISFVMNFKDITFDESLDLISSLIDNQA